MKESCRCAVLCPLRHFVGLWKLRCSLCARVAQVGRLKKKLLCGFTALISSVTVAEIYVGDWQWVMSPPPPPPPPPGAFLLDGWPYARQSRRIRDMFERCLFHSCARWLIPFASLVFCVRVCVRVCLCVRALACLSHSPGFQQCINQLLQLKCFDNRHSGCCFCADCCCCWFGCNNCYYLSTF